jgi:mannose-1-phosphate guanylyltransferase
MNALLLAAGIGSRLRPITDTVPKCMVPIAGRPLLSYWLDLMLGTAAAERVMINTHHLSRQVEIFCEAHEHAKRITLLHESKLLGTGGTLIKHSKNLMGKDLLIAHADNLTLFNPSDFLARHRKRPNRCLLTMMTFETDSPQSCGIVELDGDEVVQAFYEKVSNPPSLLANAAIFILSPEGLKLICSLFPAMPEDGETLDISLHVIPQLLGRIYTFHNSIYHRDIGDPDSLAAAEVEFPAYYSQFDRITSK